MRYLLCLSLLAAPAFSVACSNASTWHEQAECRNQQIGNEKQALDQAVSAYSATLSPADKELFKKAQSAWKAYADATCKLSAAPVAAGSMYGAYLSSCELNLSEQRRQMLEYQATCEKSSERTDCLEQFKPGSPAMSFSEGDCTSSLGWPPCVHRTSDRERSEVLCTKRRERSELLRTLVHGATKPEPPKIPAINRQAA